MTPSKLLAAIGTSPQKATAHNARHRRAQEFRTIFTSVPKRHQHGMRKRQCFRAILEPVTVRKTVIRPKKLDPGFESLPRRQLYPGLLIVLRRGAPLDPVSKLLHFW